MKPNLLGNDVQWLRPPQKNTDLGQTFETSNTLKIQTNQSSAGFDPKLWGLSLFSFLPWAVFNPRESPKLPPKANTLERSQQRVLRFRPYVSKVPWHTGARAFLSQMFPRYGNYCGPNWSSGKDNGNLVWDMRPIDWLDHCCYCHDIGYDTHDQAKLLEADFKFLDCLEKQSVTTAKGDQYVATLYKTMCTAGLKSILIPYRTQLVNLQSGNPFLHQFGWLSNVNWKIGILRNLRTRIE